MAMTANTRHTRWAVVGTGSIVRATLPDLRLTEGIEVAAVVSRSQSSADEFAAAHDIERSYGDYGLMLADPDIDVVYIGTPHSTHFELVRLAIAAGKHALCEKTFTLNAAEARELAGLGRAAGVFVMEAMWMKFNPVISRIHEVIEAGLIGEVRHVQAAFGFAAPEDPQSRLWAPELGGGALLDVGVYPITFAREFLGDPLDVVASGEMRENGLDVSEAMTFISADGGSAQLASSISTALAPTASIGGTQGYITLDQPFWCTGSFEVSSYTGARLPVTERVEVGIEGAGYVPMFRAVAEAVRDGRTEHERHTLDDTIAVLETIDRVRDLLSAQRVA